MCWRCATGSIYCQMHSVLHALIELICLVLVVMFARVSHAFAYFKSAMLSRRSRPADSVASSAALCILFLLRGYPQSPNLSTLIFWIHQLCLQCSALLLVGGTAAKNAKMSTKTSFFGSRGVPAYFTSVLHCSENTNTVLGNRLPQQLYLDGSRYNVERRTLFSFLWLTACDSTWASSNLTFRVWEVLVGPAKRGRAA